MIPGEPEKVESQTMDGKLEFGWNAKKGDAFRIYEIFPDDQTYRATAEMRTSSTAPSSLSSAVQPEV